MPSSRCTVKLLFSIFTACAHNPAPDPLLVSTSSYDFSQNPKLLARIRGSAHGYLRFINVPFSERVCEVARGFLFPTVNLHGDAHVEQYAVTDLGRGLTDFDDSSFGPAALDLLRFGVSLTLAARERGWADNGPRWFESFLSGYRRALAAPDFEAPVPSLVAVLSRDFAHDRARYFQWVDGIMDPLSPTEAESFAAAFGPYAASMRQEDPTLAATFFEIVSAGHLRMGVGSALDRKYLVRIQGPSQAPDDDVMLEVKQVRDLSAIGCIEGVRGGDPLRILVAQARLAYAPYHFLGHLRLGEQRFWVHSWVDNYRELAIAQVTDPAQLKEVAFDVGVQLGRGHPRQIAAPLDAQLRQALLDALDAHGALLAAWVVTLADEVTAAWQRFVAG